LAVVLKNEAMEQIKLLGISIAIMTIMASCAHSDTTSPKNIEAPAFDSTRAIALGADNYGMAKYVMAFLYEGPNRNLNPDESSDLQKAHMNNISKMAEEGKLALAGPFLDNGELRGIYIFNVATIEEAESLTNTDPAIKAGSLRMELRPWYGSAAVKEINQIHSVISKIKM